jgi:hypothetical protein
MTMSRPIQTPHLFGPVRPRRAWGTVIAAVLLGSVVSGPAQAAAPPVASVATVASTTVAVDPSLELPGGRPNFVVATLTGRSNALVVKIAMYIFSGDGRVKQRFWTWRQDSITGGGNAKYQKVPSGYTTAGCRYKCPIRTPLGFQHGGNGHFAAGTWTRLPDGTITVSFAGSATESWQVRTSANLASIVLSQARGNRGWGLGSTAPLTLARDMNTFYQLDRIYGPHAENGYDEATIFKHVGFHAPDYVRCSSGKCLQGKGVTAADKRTWFSSYLATNPAADGRKVFWNVQTGPVTQMEAPGSVCISSPGGGHTNALLQAIDDNGRLVGIVGVQASLNKRRHAQDVVGAYAMVPPSLSSLVEN